MIQNYEFTVILYQDEDRFKGGYDFVKSVLEKASAEIQKEEDLGVKTLGYAIQKQDRGHYVYFEITADGQQIAPMSRELQLSPEVLKFLFVKSDK